MSSLNPLEQQDIIKMFDSISESYDMANRVLSMGIDTSWRKKACALSLKALKSKTLCIADIACGTGDMIIHWQKTAQKFDIHIEKIYGIDPSSGMLEVARRKLHDSYLIQAEAINIPLESNSIDIISIAYGLRNIVNRAQAFKEFYRLLKPQGILVILEFTKNEKNTFLNSLAHIYTRKILPKIGGFISKNMEAYQYLPDSIEHFLTLATLEEELANNGFKPIYSQSYSANISSLSLSQITKKE